MKLEICIDRFESARAAKSGGANRIEVCSALSVGGITPSYGLVEQCVGLGRIEVMVMIRPHAGCFCYGPDDADTMIRDIHAAQRLGAQGIVFGALRKDGRVDRDLCRRLIDAARPLSVTFHRAFDLTPAPLAALDTLLELGVERVLTSGQADSALEGVHLIRSLVERAGKKIQVMAGAGIRPQDVMPLILATGVPEIHASASESVIKDRVSTRGIVQTTRITRQEIVRAMAQAMREAQP